MFLRINKRPLLALLIVLSFCVNCDDDTSNGVEGDADGDIDGDGDADGDVDGDTDGDVDGDADGDVDGDADGDSDGDADGDGEDLTIAHFGTTNATLMYRGAPFVGIGPMSETLQFQFKWGSSYYDHAEWFDWMQDEGFNFGRVFPASAWTGSGGGIHTDDRENRVFPFTVDHFDADDNPVVDLTSLDDEYWANFAQVLQEAENRGIVLCIQLYQKWFWGNTGNDALFYREDYNINGINEVTNNFWLNTENDFPDGPLWIIHENWVNEILDAIGERENVMIDLMNEGAFDENLTQTWIDETLNIITAWEDARGRDILVGMDIDHMISRDTDEELAWILGHPDMELIVGEDRWIYTSPDELIEMRSIYGKPIVWVNEKYNDYMETFTITDFPHRRRHYIWAGFMLKIQGLGMYEKENPVEVSTIPEASELAGYHLTLRELFDSLEDYSQLEPSPEKISVAPSEYRALLSSENEVVVYLHTVDWGETVAAGQALELVDLDIPDGAVDVSIIHPPTGDVNESTASVVDNELSLVLPHYTEGIVVYIAAQGL